MGIVSLWNRWLRRTPREEPGRKAPAAVVTGTVTITALKDTGIQVGEQPVVELTLDVEAQGVSKVTVRRREAVPLALLDRSVVGQRISVDVDPQFPESAFVDWEGLTGAN